MEDKGEVGSPTGSRAKEQRIDLTSWQGKDRALVGRIERIGKKLIQGERGRYDREIEIAMAYENVT